MKNKNLLFGLLAIALVFATMAVGCNGILFGNEEGEEKGSVGVSFLTVTADGSATETTTQLILIFNQDITGLSESNITLSGVSGVIKGTLSRTGTAYTLPISGFSASGTLSVAVAKKGYSISRSPQSANIYYYGGSGGGFVPVTEITGVPSGAVVGTLALSGTVAPSNATNKTIEWAVTSAGTTGATISGNTLTTTAAGSVTVTATIANGKTASTPFTQDFTIAITSTFVAVTNISGVATSGTANTPLALSGTVAPANATNKTIEWSVKSAGTTGAAISGNTLTATAAGSVTVTATIDNGKTASTAYTKDFIITITGGDDILAAPTLTVAPSGTVTAGTTVYISWNSIAGASGYNFYANAITGGNSTGWASESTTSTSDYLDTTGFAGYTFQFKVAAYNANGTEGAMSNVVSITVSGSNNNNQTPVASDYDISNLNQTAGSVTAVTITPKSGKSGGAITIKYTGSATIPQTAGTYAVTFDVAAASGWNAAINLSAGTLTVTSGGDDPSDFIYTQTETEVTITGYKGTKSDVTIPAKINEKPVTGIGYQAFFGTGLTSVTIPNSVTSINYGVFFNCNLITVNVDAGNTAYISDNGVLYNKDKTILHTYPPGKTGSTFTIPNSVTSIGDFAFSCCDPLTNVIIPDSVTSIGFGAFRNSNLTNVTIPNSVTSIEQGAFAYCSLTSVTIPNSVTSIVSGTFSFCVGLTEVTIPNSVTTIGNEAFAYCSSLTSIIIPDSVTIIRSAAFLECRRLTSVTFEGTITSDNFNSNAFYNIGDLRAKYLAEGIGTYKRASGGTWTKQP